MIWTSLSGLFALISVAACGYAWIQSYDLRLEQDKQESHLQSLQSRIGNVKASARQEAREAAQQAVSEMEASGGGGGGLDMESMLPMMMGMNGGGQQPQQEARNNPPPPPEQGDASLIGSGGS